MASDQRSGQAPSSFHDLFDKLRFLEKEFATSTMMELTARRISMEKLLMLTGELRKRASHGRGLLLLVSLVARRR
jgi:hypothetical protein